MSQGSERQMLGSRGSDRGLMGSRGSIGFSVKEMSLRSYSPDTSII